MEKNKKEYNNNKDKNEKMTEKVHYEVRFIETDDGFRLEATGDKKALKKLGIGPNMLNKKRRGQRGMKRGRGSGPQGMKRSRARRAAAARRRHAWQRHGQGIGRWHMSPGPRRRFRHYYSQEAQSGERGHRGAPGYL